MHDMLIDGRYQVAEEIGAGGEATVFRARDTLTDVEVAMRLPLRAVTYRAPDMIPDSHPGWVEFVHWGVDPQWGAYQVFELLIGLRLSQVVSSGPLDAETWRGFVEQSLDAVAALHASGWAHGDLNADNFILSASSRARWKLLELPFLRFDPPSDRSALFGSIHTLAPEQLNGAPAGFSSDLYALGCLYYFAAAGRFPHQGENNRQIAIERLRFAPEPLAGKARQLPVAWSGWVMGLLEGQPQNRPASVAGARQLLEVA